VLLVMVAASLATRAVASSRSMKISADIRASLGEEAILGPMFPCRCDGHHKMWCGREYPPLLGSAVWPRSCDASASTSARSAAISAAKSATSATTSESSGRDIPPICATPAADQALPLIQRATTPQRWRAKPPQTLPGRPPLRGATNKAPATGERGLSRDHRACRVATPGKPTETIPQLVAQRAG
jgi:hypothetical protein